MLTLMPWLKKYRREIEDETKTDDPTETEATARSIGKISASSDSEDLQKTVTSLKKKNKQLKKRIKELEALAGQEADAEADETETEAEEEPKKTKTAARMDSF